MSLISFSHISLYNPSSFLSSLLLYPFYPLSLTHDSLSPSISHVHPISPILSWTSSPLTKVSLSLTNLSPQTTDCYPRHKRDQNNSKRKKYIKRRGERTLINFPSQLRITTIFFTLLPPSFHPCVTNSSINLHSFEEYTNLKFVGNKSPTLKFLVVLFLYI